MIEALAPSLYAGLVAASFGVSAIEAAVSSIDRTDRATLQADPRGQRALARLEVAGLDTSLILVDLLLTFLAMTAGVTALLPFVPLVAAVGIIALATLILRATSQAIGAAWRLGWVRRSNALLALMHLLAAPGRFGAVRVGERVAARGVQRKVTVERQEREQEILALVERGTTTGTVDERERDIVEAVFEFGELTVGRLMTPRPDMVAVPIDIAWDALLRILKEHGYSRVPVYRGRVDEVIGVLLMKDILRYHAEAPANPSLVDLRGSLIPPVFVPQTKPANAMLREFLSRTNHMAFVVDEHGTLAGLVTLDDLLRELVGELLDHDDLLEDDSISIDRTGHFRVKAWMDIDDFCEETGIELPREGYNTLGGFVFHVLGRLPHRGDHVQADGYRFTVVQMEGRRIGELQVEPIGGREERP